MASLLIALADPAISADCTRREAVRATVPQVAQHPDEYMDKCVLIDGVMHGHSMFATVDGVYLKSPDVLDDTKSGQRIGIDGRSDENRPGYQHVSVLGRIQDCDAIRAMVQASAGPDEVVMTAGYCHSAYGPYVYIHRLRYRPGAPFVRQVGDYERADYGDIEPVPANWPHRAMIETLAGKFLAALRARDRATLADIHFRNVGLEWEDDEAQLLHFLLEDSKSPFASLRLSRSAPQMMILSYRYLAHPAPDDDPHEAEEDYSAFACFCRENDCSGRWPLASFDADNLPGRPYACTMIEPYASGHETVAHFRTPAEKTGLAEPKHLVR